MPRHASSFLVLVCLLSSAALATPTISVTPATLDRFDATTPEVSVTGLVGSEAILRVLVDVDHDGVADGEDFAIWTDVVPDNALEWSPSMLPDLDGTSGSVTVYPRHFTPFGHPHAVGHYLWQAEDPADGSLATTPFVVTQATEAQAASGRIETAGGAAVPGALAVLVPASDACRDVEVAAFADADGNYTIEFPGGLPCSHRIVAAGRPGYFGDLFYLPHLVFTGADRFTGIDPTLTLGANTVAGTIAYASGPRSGQGIPGQLVFAGSGSLFAIGITDAAGSYALGLSGGSWEIQADSGLLAAEQGAVIDADASTVVGVAGPITAPDISHPAANAFVTGLLLDDDETEQPSERLRGNSQYPCAPCYSTNAVTRPDGSYVASLVAPASPGTASWTLEPERPIDGLIATRVEVTLSENETLTDVDLEHLTPTAHVTGQVTDPSGTPVGDLCLYASSGAPGLFAHGRVGCDGAYSIPVIDGGWHVRFEGDDFIGPHRNLDVTRVELHVDVSGQDVAGADLILGEWLGAPRIVTVDPPAATPGEHVVLFGYNFSSTSANPRVTVGGLTATIVAYRPAIGRIVFAVPASLPAGPTEIVVTDLVSGRVSEPRCFEALAGSFAPACTISGTLTRNGGTFASAGGVVVVLDGETERFLRAAVSNASGNYTLSLEDPGASYTVAIVPPANPRRVWGRYEGVSCPATLSHDFVGGRDVDGQVVDQDGQGIPNVLVEAEGQLDYGEKLTDAAGNFNVRMRDGDFVSLRISAPVGSRYRNTVEPIGLTIDDNIVLPPVSLDPGLLFVGRVVDGAGGGLETHVGAHERWSGTPSGSTRSNACTGRFEIALAPGEHRLHLEGGESEPETAVEWIEMTSDALSEFDFSRLDGEPIQHTGPEPRVADDSDASGAIGQPVVLQVENLGPTGVEVLFAASGGGTVAGDETGWDVARGLVVTRVPATAVSGDLVVSVEGLDSPPLPFRVRDEAWDAGSFTLGGFVIVGVDPVPGAIVALLRPDPDAPGCDDDDLLQDYALTNSSGAYAVHHSGGDVFLAVLPPAGLALAPGALEFPGESGDRTDAYVALQSGESVTLRVVTGSSGPEQQAAGLPPTPVPNAVVYAEGDAFDWRVSDASGEVTLHTGVGTVFLRIVGPVGSRLVPLEFAAAPPAALGDVNLSPGVFVSGRAVDEAGAPVAGARGEAFQQNPPFGDFFSALVRGNGVWRGAVDGFAPYFLEVSSGRPELADAGGGSSDGHGHDLIRYPSSELLPAGFVTGTVRDAVTQSPIPWTSVGTLFEQGGSYGPPSAFGQTCDDGTFTLKVPVGSHGVTAFGASELLQGWYSPGSTGDSCALDAEAISVTQGAVVSDVDVELDPLSSVNGIAWLYSDPAENASIQVTGGRLGSCVAHALTDEDGFYWAQVPAGEGYRVEAFPPPEFTGPSQCWERIDGCSSFTPVTAAPFSGTWGVDFFFGHPPGVVSADAVPLTVEPSNEYLRLTFEQLPPEQHADAYNVYAGALGAFDFAQRTECWLGPGGLQDNGDGTFSHYVLPGEGSEWYLVSASNAVGESSPGTTALSNACGPLPID